VSHIKFSIAYYLMTKYRFRALLYRKQTCSIASVFLHHVLSVGYRPPRDKTLQIDKLLFGAPIVICTVSLVLYSPIKEAPHNPTGEECPLHTQRRR
jgi:hypothetical protein